MFKSYFYLYRFVLENREELSGATITNIYTQEKNKLFLSLPTEAFPYRHLIMDVNQNFTSLLLKSEHHKAKKNFKDFLNDSLPQKILDLEICKDDRLVKFKLEDGEIYFSVMGSRSNIYFAFPNEFSAFRKAEIEQAKDFLTSKKFVTPAPHFSFEEKPETNFDELRKTFPFLNKFIRNEYLLRGGNENQIDFELLENICNEIISGKITVGLDEGDFTVRMFPSSFLLFKNFKILSQHSDFNSALLDHLRHYYYFTKQQQLKKELRQAIERELEKLSNRLNELSSRVEEGSKENRYRKFADLLNLNRHKVFKGMKEIEVTDFETNEEIKIPLDEKLNAQQNIERYYTKAREERVAFEKSVELFEASKEKYSQLFELRQRLDDITDLKELELLKKNLTKKNLKTGVQTKTKFRHFLIESKYHLFVGRDSKENDELTFRFAKQNDYWFHARGYAGSHVVLRNSNPKEKIPKNILKSAASVAAFYSKGKTASLVPVSFTFRKFVRKQKGMEPGKVLLQREETLIVKPEIPTNCEQVFE